MLVEKFEAHIIRNVEEEENGMSLQVAGPFYTYEEAKQAIIEASEEVLFVRATIEKHFAREEV